MRYRVVSLGQLYEDMISLFYLYDIIISYSYATIIYIIYQNIIGAHASSYFDIFIFNND